MCIRDRAQVKLPVPVHVPWDGVIVPWLKPAGQRSVRLTPVASDGPVLWTLIVYVPVLRPAVTLLTPSVLVTERSALVMTVSVSEAALFFRSGSVTL